MASNFVVLIQFLAVDAKYQPSTDKRLAIVNWVEDMIPLIYKLADHS